MTRKDYELIAGVLADQIGGGRRTLDDLIVAFADALAADNPRFDRTRFYGAATGMTR